MVDAILIKHTATRTAPLEPADIDALRDRYPNILEIPIEPPNRNDKLDQFDESYPWAEAVRAQEQGHQAVIAAKQQHPNAKLLYMGFVPIPLAFHLGTLFGQTTRVEIFQYQNRLKTWAWPSTEATPERELLRPLLHLRTKNPAKDILFRVSCSHEILAEQTQAIAHGAYDIDVDINRASSTSLRSQADLWAFAYHFRDALDASMTAYPNAPLRHLVASVPVGVAFAMGLQVNPTKHLPIQTWKFLNKRERPYARTLCIGEHQRIPGVMLIGAAPMHEKPISAAAEVQELGDLLGAEALEHRVRVTSRPAGGIHELTELLAEFDPRAVHIGCHGHDDNTLGPSLTLSTLEGGATEIERDDLLRLLRRAPNVECVVLAACESNGLARDLAKDVPAVIGFEGELYDSDGRDFGRQLWTSLAAGHDIKEAFADAKLAFDPSRRHQPKLCLRDGVDASRLILIPR